MNDSEFFVPTAAVASAALDELARLTDQLGEPRQEVLGADGGRLFGARYDWPCGSWAESSTGYLPGDGTEVVRFVVSIRGGPVHGHAFARSPWAAPVEIAPFSGEPELALKGLGLAPWDVPLVDPPPNLPSGGRRGCEDCAAGMDPALCRRCNPDPLDGLSERAREVLNDLDGERKRIRRAKEYHPCVACGEALVVGQLYEHQAGKSSPRRRIHVECLEARGLA